MTLAIPIYLTKTIKIMQDRKLFISLAAALTMAAGFTSCSNDDVLEGQPLDGRTPITLTSSVATRSVSQTLQDDQIANGVKVGVFAQSNATAIENGDNNMLTADGDRERLVVENFGIHKSYKFYALIPDFELSTKLSRDVLPKAVGLTAAKKNIANVPLLIKALENGDGDLLRVASEDWLHQPYRGGIIAGYFDIRQRALDAGACAVFLSGAGPTMLAVSTVDMKKQLADITSDMENTWQVKRIKVDFDGVTVERT